MKAKLKEYNVVPNKEEKNEVVIEMVDNQLSYNNKIIQDNSEIESIIKFINEYKEDIINLNNEKIESRKGGRQKSIDIQFDNDDKVYKLIGNTPSNESVNLYNIIKDKLVSIIEE